MKVVLFDIDHTLLASPTGANAEASRIMFNQVFGINTSEDSVEKVGMTEWGLIEKVLHTHGQQLMLNEHGRVEVPEVAYRVWAESLRKTARDKQTRLEPGIKELLEALCAKDEVKLGLLTGNSYWRSEVKLELAGIDTFFRDRTGNLEGAFGNEARTREGLLSFAQDRLVFLHDQLIIIDDSLLGAQMTKEHDLLGVLVATGSASEEELRNYSPYVYPNLGEERWKEVVSIIEAS